MARHGDGDDDDDSVDNVDVEGGVSSADGGGGGIGAAASSPSLLLHSDSSLDVLRNRAEGLGLTKQTVLTELRQLAILALPNSAAMLLQMSLGLVMTFAMGHYGGALELGALSLGNMFCNVTGLSLGWGMAMAMDTLASQAFGQDRKSPMVGIVLQRGILIELCMCIPIGALWLNAEAILLALHQDPDVSRLAGQFAMYVLPGLPFFLVFECLKKYLLCQGIMYAPMLALGFAACVNGLCCYIFIYALDFGFVGAPISYSISALSLPLFLLCWIYFRNLHKDTWYGWSWQALKGWPQFLRFGVPGMIMLMNEWWAFEIVALMAGLLGEVQLAAQTVILVTASFMYMLTFGVAVATSVRVGNLLGAGEPTSAFRCALIGTFLGLLTAIFAALVIFAARQSWGYLFTEDLEVVQTVAEVLLIYSLFAIVDGLQGLGASILRGVGKQIIGAILNFTGFYVIGLPLAYVLCFQLGLGLHGLWWGLCAGLIFCCTSYNFTIWRMDWAKEAKKAQDRILADRSDLQQTHGQNMELTHQQSGHFLLTNLADDDHVNGDDNADEQGDEFVGIKTT